jgi:hypothetical protein
MMTISENRHWHATGKRHCMLLSAWSVAKHSQDAIATPMMMRADCTINSAPRFSAGRVSLWRIGTATVESPTPTPAICVKLSVEDIRGFREGGPRRRARDGGWL